MPTLLRITDYGNDPRGVPKLINPEALVWMEIQPNKNGRFDLYGSALHVEVSREDCNRVLARCEIVK